MEDGVKQLYKVHVKNIADEFDDDQLWALFDSCGEIHHCKVVLDNHGKSSGCGYVVFKHPEAVQLAVDRFNGKYVYGSIMCVQRPTKNEDLHHSLNHTFNTIFIHNLGARVDADTLCEVFAPFGTITSAQVLRRRKKDHQVRTGVVRYSTPREVERALIEMDGGKMFGRRLNISALPGKSVYKKMRDMNVENNMERSLQVTTQPIDQQRGVEEHVDSVRDGDSCGSDVVLLQCPCLNVSNAESQCPMEYSDKSGLRRHMIVEHRAVYWGSQVVSLSRTNYIKVLRRQYCRHMRETTITFDSEKAHRNSRKSEKRAVKIPEPPSEPEPQPAPEPLVKKKKKKKKKKKAAVENLPEETENLPAIGWHDETNLSSRGSADECNEALPYAAGATSVPELEERGHKRKFPVEQNIANEVRDCDNRPHWMTAVDRDDRVNETHHMVEQPRNSYVLPFMPQQQQQQQQGQVGDVDMRAVPTTIVWTHERTRLDCSVRTEDGPRDGGTEGSNRTSHGTLQPCLNATGTGLVMTGNPGGGDSGRRMDDDLRVTSSGANLLAARSPAVSSSTGNSTGLAGEQLADLSAKIKAVLDKLNGTDGGVNSWGRAREAVGSVEEKTRRDEVAAGFTVEHSFAERPDNQPAGVKNPSAGPSPGASLGELKARNSLGYITDKGSVIGQFPFHQQPGGANSESSIMPSKGCGADGPLSRHISSLASGQIEPEASGSRQVFGKQLNALPFVTRSQPHVVQSIVQSAHGVPPRIVPPGGESPLAPHLRSYSEIRVPPVFVAGSQQHTIRGTLGVPPRNIPPGGECLPVQGSREFSELRVATPIDVNKQVGARPIATGSQQHAVRGTLGVPPRNIQPGGESSLPQHSREFSEIRVAPPIDVNKQVGARPIATVSQHHTIRGTLGVPPRNIPPRGESLLARHSREFSEMWAASVDVNEQQQAAKHSSFDVDVTLSTRDDRTALPIRGRNDQPADIEHLSADAERLLTDAIRSHKAPPADLFKYIPPPAVAQSNVELSPPTSTGYFKPLEQYFTRPAPVDNRMHDPNPNSTVVSGVEAANSSQGFVERPPCAPPSSSQDVMEPLSDDVNAAVDNDWDIDQEGKKPSPKFSRNLLRDRWESLKLVMSLPAYAVCSCLVSQHERDRFKPAAAAKWTADQWNRRVQIWRNKLQKMAENARMRCPDQFPNPEHSDIRWHDIASIKSTDVYQLYIRKTPREKRTPQQPSTPDISDCPNDVWLRQLSMWRQKLNYWMRVYAHSRSQTKKMKKMMKMTMSMRTKTKTKKKKKKKEKTKKSVAHMSFVVGNTLPVPNREYCREELALESLQSVLARRDGEIDRFKQSYKYQMYSQSLPRDYRSRADPSTPDRNINYSVAQWSELVADWQRKVNWWTPANAGEEPQQDTMPGPRMVGTETGMSPRVSGPITFQPRLKNVDDMQPRPPMCYNPVAGNRPALNTIGAQRTVGIQSGTVPRVARPTTFQPRLRTFGVVPPRLPVGNNPIATNRPELTVMPAPRIVGNQSGTASRVTGPTTFRPRMGNIREIQPGLSTSHCPISGNRPDANTVAAPSTAAAAAAVSVVSGSTVQSRLKSIGEVKSSQTYCTYMNTVPRKCRSTQDPKTPDRLNYCSDEEWQLSVEAWRRELQQWYTGTMNPNSKTSEKNETVLAFRQGQIGHCKKSAAYQNYCRVVPRIARSHIDPKTPDVNSSCSPVQWDELMSEWRQKVNSWKP